MRYTSPTALGWIDPTSPTPEWDAAQVRRLAVRLGYTLRWADSGSSPGLVEQVESSGVDAVLLPSSAHVDAATLHRLVAITDVECAAPRTSFARWSPIATAVEFGTGELDQDRRRPS